MSRTATKAQRLLLCRMADGARLWWYGFNDPELEGYPRWPQARTVRAMIKAGSLRWLPYRNETQRRAGIRELEAAPGACPHCGAS